MCVFLCVCVCVCVYVCVNVCVMYTKVFHAVFGECGLVRFASLLIVLDMGFTIANLSEFNLSLFHHPARLPVFCVCRYESACVPVCVWCCIVTSMYVSSTVSSIDYVCVCVCLMVHLHLQCDCVWPFINLRYLLRWSGLERDRESVCVCERERER